MPLSKAATKALRVNKRKEITNKPIRSALKSAVKLARTNPNLKNLTKAFSTLDRAAKKGIIHGGKANRLKSRLSKLVKLAKKK